MQLADIATAFTSADGASLQDVLSTLNVKERLHKVLVLLRKELEVIQLQKKITLSIEESNAKAQRKFWLNEQLKTIKRELGLEKEDKEELRQKFLARLANKTVPEEVDKVINEELNKLSSLESNSSEFNITRNYLDWLTVMPWGVHTQENFELAHAEKVLNEDHYGLEDIKTRILEFIAVGKLLGAAPQGKIMLFVGPPGVGKTSIGA